MITQTHPRGYKSRIFKKFQVPLNSLTSVKTAKPSPAQGPSGGGGDRGYPEFGPGTSLFCDTGGGKGGGEILEEAGTFSGQALLLSYPYPGGGGVQSRRQAPQYLLRIYSLKESQPGAGADTGALFTLVPGFGPTTCGTLVQCSTARVLTRSGYQLLRGRMKILLTNIVPQKGQLGLPPPQGGGRVFPLRAPRISKKAGRHPPPGGGCARH